MAVVSMMQIRIIALTEYRKPLMELLQRRGVVQLQNEDGAYYHTLLVSGIDPEAGILVAAHSNDAFDRPLSTYTYAAARFLQVSGVRVELDVSTGSCFYDLIGGIAIKP